MSLVFDIVSLDSLFMYSTQCSMQYVPSLIPITRPGNCTTGYLPPKYRCSEKKGHMLPNVHSSNVHNSQTGKSRDALQQMNGQGRCDPYI